MTPTGNPPKDEYGRAFRALTIYLVVLSVVSALSPVAGAVLLLAGTVFYFWTER